MALAPVLPARLETVFWVVQEPPEPVQEPPQQRRPLAFWVCLVLPLVLPLVLGLRLQCSRPRIKVLALSVNN